MLSLQETELMFRPTPPARGQLETVPNVAAVTWGSRIINGHTFHDVNFSTRSALKTGPIAALIQEQARHVTSFTSNAGGTVDILVNTYRFYESYNPHGSASRTTQHNRSAMIYQTEEPTTGDYSLLRTSREFYARARPTGYVAQGREIIYRFDDSLRAVVTGTMHDAWVADDDHSTVLRFAERDSLSTYPDSLSQAQRLFRTECFQAHDSTRIGFEIHGRFLGDTTLYDSARFDFVVELVDSTTGIAVAELDSFAITSPTDHYHNLYRTDFDLLSSTYYLRMRLVTANFTPDFDSSVCRYPVADVKSIVDSNAFGKLRRSGAVTGSAIRLSAQPNPFGGETEIMFSVPTAGYVTMTLYNQKGQPVAEPVVRMLIEAGRYSVTLDGADLTPGTYLVELVSGSNRKTMKVVVLR